MPRLKKFPRTYKVFLADTVAELKVIADKARHAFDITKTGRNDQRRICVYLQEIEVTALKLALTITDIEASPGCDGCPFAPAATREQAALYAIVLQMKELLSFVEEAARSDTQRIIDNVESTSAATSRTNGFPHGQ